MSNLIGIKIIECKKNENKKITDDLFVLDEIGERQSDLNGFVGWPVFNSIKGAFYALFSKQRHDMGDDVLGASDIVDFLPIDTKDITWLPTTYFQYYSGSQEYIAEIKKGFKRFFRKILKELVKLSESRTLAVLFQIQEPAKERYFGTISLKDFFNLLNERKILHNIVYFVKG